MTSKYAAFKEPLPRPKPGIVPIRPPRRHHLVDTQINVRNILGEPHPNPLLVHKSFKQSSDWFESHRKLKEELKRFYALSGSKDLIPEFTFSRAAALILKNEVESRNTTKPLFTRALQQAIEDMREEDKKVRNFRLGMMTDEHAMLMRRRREEDAIIEQQRLDEIRNSERRILNREHHTRAYEQRKRLLHNIQSRRRISGAHNLSGGRHTRKLRRRR